MGGVRSCEVEACHRGVFFIGLFFLAMRRISKKGHFFYLSLLRI